MKGFGRSLRYWSYILQRQFLMMVGMMTAIVAIMTFMEGGDYVAEITRIFPMYCVLLMVLTAFMNALNGSSIYFPISISLGDTRKWSCISLQLVQHLIMVEYLVIAAVVLAFTNQELISRIAESTFLIIGVVTLLIGIANIVTIINFKLGKKAAMITYFVLIFGIFACVGGLVGFFGEAFGTVVVNTLVSKQYIGLIGIIFDLVTLIVFYNVVKKSNLQF